MHIFLIRHAESITNAGENYEKRIPDHLVSLTENGMKQAEEQGRRLAEYCRAKGVDLTRARIWRSPYLRTRQTSEEFNKSLGISDIREDITLTEQQFGLFDSLPEEDWGRLFPVEYAEYRRQRDNFGKFYARLPMGEMMSVTDNADKTRASYFGVIENHYDTFGQPALYALSSNSTINIRDLINKPTVSIT